MRSGIAPTCQRVVRALVRGRNLREQCGVASEAAAPATNRAGLFQEPQCGVHFLPAGPDQGRDLAL